jgi:hypothetical protein
MATHGGILEEAYARFVDEHAREAERLRAAREQKDARTRRGHAELRRALEEAGPFLRAQGFFLVADEAEGKGEGGAAGTRPLQLAASVGDAASGQVVVTVTVEGDTFGVAQPLLLGAEPHVTGELGDALVRVAQVLAAHRCSLPRGPLAPP